MCLYIPIFTNYIDIFISLNLSYPQVIDDSAVPKCPFRTPAVSAWWQWTTVRASAPSKKSR